MQPMEQGTAVFVMPHFGDTPRSREYLALAIASVEQQTDPEWHLVIVDDFSPRAEDRVLLTSLASSESAPRITVILNEQRGGPGPARNLGIAQAVERNAPFVLFLDSDDLASPDRLTLTRAAFENSATDVVYSLFEPIDGSGQPLSKAALAPSIQVILDAITQAPPTGPRAWIEMATTTGYTNLTSTTSVRTAVAAAVPFPAELVSEDMHTWFRYGGFGASFTAIPAVTCRYRIPDPAAGSSCRRRFGTGFYAEKARVDLDGLQQAIAMSLTAGRLTDQQATTIRLAFRERLARELRAQGEHAVADQLLA